MNALEVAAMLDKIAEAGGSLHVKDGDLYGRDVPKQFHEFIKSSKQMIIRMLSNRDMPVKRTVASCKACKWANPNESCGQPVKAALSASYAIRWHDMGGIGCAAFDDR